MTTLRSTNEALTGVLEPGEAVLWSGRPDVDVILRLRRRRGLVGKGVGFAILAGAVAWAARGGLLDFFSWDLALEPRFLVPAAVVVVGMPLLSALGGWRFRRYVASLDYAITDRRLLVLEHGEIVDDYPPERVGQVTMRPRGREHGDVVFGLHLRVGSLGHRTRDPVLREREVVAFKALRAAEEVRDRVESWLEDRRREAERSGGPAVSASDHPSSSLAPPADRLGPDVAPRRLRQGPLGLEIALPAAWSIRVRWKERPRGHSFFDAEHWRDPEAPEDWTLVRAEGPLLASVEAEVFETVPTVDFERTVGGHLAAAVAGAVCDADPHVEIGGVPGFAVTRRREVTRDPVTGQAMLAAAAMRERHTVLHDGRRQVYVVSTWPEDSPGLARTVDEAVRSVRLEG